MTDIFPALFATSTPTTLRITKDLVKIFNIFQGKGQHRVQALHVVDAMVLAGDNLLAKNFNER